MIRNPTRYVTLLSVLGLLAIVSSDRMAGTGESWLASGDPPRPSDLIVVLDGGAAERTATAIDLYREGFAPVILITSSEGVPDAQMRRMVSGGIPSRALLAPLQPSGSTWEDAVTIRQTVLREKVDSILVVTSSFHCRRARLIMERVLADIPVRITLTQAKSLYPWPWWRTVPPEYLKLAWAWLAVPKSPCPGKRPSVGPWHTHGGC